MIKTKTLEMCSQIESAMTRPITYLEKLGQTEDAKGLKIIQKKYYEVIISYMSENNIPKMSFQLSRNFVCEYTVSAKKIE